MCRHGEVEGTCSPRKLRRKASDSNATPRGARTGFRPGRGPASFTFRGGRRNRTAGARRDRSEVQARSPAMGTPSVRLESGLPRDRTSLAGFGVQPDPRSLPRCCGGCGYRPRRELLARHLSALADPPLLSRTRPGNRTLPSRRVIPERPPGCEPRVPFGGKGLNLRWPASETGITSRWPPIFFLSCPPRRSRTSRRSVIDRVLCH